jgi:RNA recognition motif-containing protein
MKNKPSSTVYISNLSYERDRNGLKSLFSKFGTIKFIKIIVEPATNQSRGMAFVEMASIEEAQKAIDSLNQTVIDGRTVKANFAIPQRAESVSKKIIEKKDKKKDNQKDLSFKATQLAKKARNEAKRKANPFDVKLKKKA